MPTHLHETASPPVPRSRTALLLPWALLAVVTGLVWLDQRGTEANNELSTLDPHCGMEARRKTAHKVDHGGKTYYFCSTFCRVEFLKDPESYAQTPAEADSHTMPGLPTWMYQASVALILLLSFGLFELLSKYSARGADFMRARVDLTALPGVRRLLKWPPLIFVLRAVTTTAFLVVVAAGLFGDQNPRMNIAPLLTWTVWWAGLIFVVLFLGKAWCTVCPWDAFATWMERLKFWGPRGAGTGLGMPWPAWMRNIWPAAALFLLLTWIELGMGVTLIPSATAWIALGMLGLAIVSVFLYDRKAFCRYGCLVGRVSGLYALFSPLEVRAKDDNICASCRTMDCYRGNEKGDGCPTFEFPRSIKLNTYCTLCTECFKTCPQDNMSLRLRPWGADLACEGRPRTDEAFLALILLSMTGFHGLTMTPKWTAANTALQTAWGIPYMLSFSLLMGGMLLLPIVLFAGLTRLSTVWSGEVGYKPLFLNFAYALLPIALFYHLAHNAEHFLMEGPKLLALFSDPFGRGWDIFGTAAWKPAPMVTHAGLWRIQILFVLVGHLYGLWITEKTTRRLIPDRRAAVLAQLPMLIAMAAFSTFSLWLLRQPMEMRLSAM